jgi:malonyl-CoA O-methyltransferase
VRWLIDHHLPSGGIAVDSDRQVAYPEVTGYTIPTLLDCGEQEYADHLGEWLISVQRADGGFAGPDGLNEAYLFDTAQAMRGLLALVDRVPGAEEALRRAADWMVRATDDRGVVCPRADSVWSRRYSGHISENIHLYALPPLLEAGRLLGVPGYVDVVERSLQRYLEQPDLLRFRFLTHFYGYVLEALVDLGRADLARLGLQDILDGQTEDGAIPALPGAKWICSPGTAQLALVGYKLGLLEFANGALEYLQGLQTPTGGFLGSYGRGATYSPRTELSWACKYFLDACHWRVRATAASQREGMPSTVDPDDARLLAILESVGPVDGKRVLSVGCGGGPYLRALHARTSGADLWGVDISEEVLESLPAGITTRRATALNLSFADGTIDVVLCVEALGHTMRIERAIDEMCRVLRPGGKIVIIDKNVRYLRQRRIDVWERWFEPDDIAGLLTQRCEAVTWKGLATPLDRDEGAVLVRWQGVRRVGSNAGPLKSATPPDSIAQRRTIENYRKARRLADAHSLIESGFRSYWNGDLHDARSAFVRAVRLDPTWLTNRGVAVVLARSLWPVRSSRRGDAAESDRH